MSRYDAASTVDFSEIPVIDITGLTSATARPAVVETLVETAREIGFFYISGHGVDPELRRAAFAAAERFFELPQPEKQLCAVDQNQRGWMGVGASVLEGSSTYDAKEVFFWGWDIADNDPDLALPLVAQNRWPQTAPWLRAAIEPYYLEVVSLGTQIITALFEGLGADPQRVADAYAKPLARGQLVGYPPVSAADRAATRFSAAPHTDFGVLTLLAQDDSGGLQVLNASNAWIEAPPIPNTFVCNIGDLLQHWTGGQLRSTRHRVMNRARTARYSIPIFCDPASGTRIDPADFGQTSQPADALTAGAYIAGKNRKNFTHYTQKTS